MREIENLKPVRKIDLVGFTYGDYHSSQFGLVRVSSGNRYSEYLSPTLKMTTTEVEGMDGVLYFRTNKGQRNFTVNVAFDKVKEADIRDIKEWLSGEPKPLIFDERPYVKYMCVVSSAPQIQYLMFDEEGERVYKGEMTINFVSYMSYGLSVKEFAEEYLEENFDEWSDTSGLPYKTFYDEEGETHEYNVVEDGKTMYVYNAGDVETDYELVLYVDSATAEIEVGGSKATFTLPVLSKGGNGFKLSANSKMGYAYAEEVKFTTTEEKVTVEVVGDKILLITDDAELPELPRGRSKILLSAGTYTNMATITYHYRYV